MSEKRIHDLIEPVLSAMGLELWACELHHAGNQTWLRVYIDRGTGVTVDDCSRASREIAAILDVEDPIKNRYQLEISSPGINRTLHTLSHYQKYLGSDVKVKLRSALANRKQFGARIEKVIDNKIILTVENDTISLTLGEIQKANLM